nr:odorant receptor 5 [Pachyrhinus yasumatsui]
MGFTAYSSHFQILFKSLKYFGAWVDYDQSLAKIYFIYCCLINVLFIFAGNLSMAIFWLKNSNSIKAFAAIGYLVPISNMVIVKSYYLFKNRRIFNKLITDLDQDIFKPQNSEELRIVNKSLYKWWKVKTTLILLTLLSPITLILAPFFYPENGNLPFQPWIPFHILPKYEIVYIYQSIFGMLNSGISIFTDISVSGLCLFISLLCDLLCTRLERIGTVSGLTETNKHFISCVYLHTCILDFLNTIEQVFGRIYFVQIFATTTSMCMDLFLLSSAEPGYEFFYLLIYLIAISNLLLVPCWFATEMTRKSERIPNAAYSCNWIDGTNGFKKDLTFLIARTQRPMKLYAGNYYEISVEIFVKIFKIHGAGLWLNIFWRDFCNNG